MTRIAGQATRKNSTGTVTRLNGVVWPVSRKR